MTVIVVLVNGTLSYVELSQSRPQQLAEARRINLLSFSHNLPILLPFPFSLTATISSLYYRFMAMRHRRPATGKPPEETAH